MRRWQKSLIAVVLTIFLALGSLSLGAVDYSALKLGFGERNWHLKFNSLVDQVQSGVTTLTAQVSALAAQVLGFVTAEDQLVYLPAPTYVDTDTFTLPGDVTAKLGAGKVLLLDLGADGVKFNSVAGSSFGGGVTTVDVVTANLTSNLARAAVFATRTGLWPWGDGRVMGRDYGVPGQAALDAAISFIASNNRTLTLYPGDWEFTGTIPRNITLEAPPGAQFTGTGTVTLQCQKIIASTKIFNFTGAGNAVWSVPHPPDALLWLAADGVTDDGPAWQKMINAIEAGGGGSYDLPGGAINVATQIALKYNVTGRGRGCGVTVIKDSTSGGAFVSGESLHDGDDSRYFSPLLGVTIDASANANNVNMVQLNHAAQRTVWLVEFKGNAAAAQRGFQFNGAYQVYFSNSRLAATFKNCNAADGGLVFNADATANGGSNSNDLDLVFAGTMQRGWTLQAGKNNRIRAKFHTAPVNLVPSDGTGGAGKKNVYFVHGGGLAESVQGNVISLWAEGLTSAYVAGINYSMAGAHRADRIDGCPQMDDPTSQVWTPNWATKETATYMAANQFTVPGDKTATFAAGMKIHYQEADSWKSDTVLSSAYTTVTTVTTVNSRLAASGTVFRAFDRNAANPHTASAWINGNLWTYFARLGSLVIGADGTEIKRLRIGTFTWSAAAAHTVTEAAVTTDCNIHLTPTNAAAGTLIRSHGWYLKTRTANTSFTVETADAAAAAGTETFIYELKDPN